MSITRRAIEVEVTQEDGTITTLKDLRMYCGIEIAGGYTMGNCHAAIYGVPLSLINKLTSIGANFQKHLAKNQIQVRAGDEGEALSLVYQGQIQYAFGQFQDAPNVSLQIMAYEGYTGLLKPATAISYDGPVSVATLMQNLAKEGGYGFENNDVNVQMSNPAYGGTIFDMLRTIADDANVNFVLDKNTVVIWPKGQARSISNVTVSPSNGLVGYPQLSSTLTYIKTEFRPDVAIGTPLTLQDSIVSAANGNWVVVRVQHNIAAHYPGGPWFTDMTLAHVTQ